MTLPFAFLQNLGAGEIILILAVLLLLFGSSKLPKLARSLGSSMTEFKKGLRGEPSADEPAKKLDEKAGEKTKTGE
ncbi:MAG: twin-arginine translocase TatA/TatE family subunit [Planctomycetes bacterium]|nr:twin-arginine translocase TatA/TatE family subunit [Planctomycetota bacterium]